MQSFLGGTWRLGLHSGVEAAGYGMRVAGPLLKPWPVESGAATRGTRRDGEAASTRTQESWRLTTLTRQAGPTSSDSGWEADESRATRQRLAGGVTPARARREGSGLRGSGPEQGNGPHRVGPDGNRKGISAWN